MGAGKFLIKIHCLLLTVQLLVKFLQFYEMYLIIFCIVAVDKLPNFLALPNKSRNEVGEQHKGTIHLNCEDLQLVHNAYLDAINGSPSKKCVK